MIPKYTLKEISKVAGGVLVGKDLPIEDVSIDSRQIKEGSLYVALKGNNFDGHNFIDEALYNGASAFVSEKEFNSLGSYIKVDDGYTFLYRLGQIQRNLFVGKSICITGSNGKTSTKEIISQILANISDTHATFGNQNNILGLSLTLLGLKENHNFLVTEIGTNQKGEIQELSSIVKPDLAIITNVAHAHVEKLGSLEDIALEKGDILNSLDHEGIGVLPRDSSFYNLWKQKLGNRKLVTFGMHKNSDLRISSISVDVIRSRTSFHISYLGKETFCSINAIGAHNALNACAALAAISLLNIDWDIALKAIEDVIFPPRRLTLMRGINDSILVDDSYNANPDSVKLALDEISRVGDFIKIFIAGEMRELGKNEKDYHQEVLKYAKDKVDEIWCVGTLWKDSCNMKIKRISFFNNNEELLDYATTRIDNNYLVLLKGSHSSLIDVIADGLKKN